MTTRLNTFFLLLCGVTVVFRSFGSAALANDSGFFAEPACDYALDVAFVQDASTSFDAHMDNVKAALPDLMTELAEIHPGSQFSLITFTDTPLFPFGCSSYDDLPFRQQTKWTSDPQEFYNALDGLDTDWGCDNAEAQLTVLNHIGAAKIFPRETHTPSGRPVQRFVILSTDMSYHVAGDIMNLREEYYDQECTNMGSQAGCCDYKLSDYRRIPYSADGHLWTGQLDSDGVPVVEDYPSPEEAVGTLKDENAFVILLTSPGKPDTHDIYKALVPVFEQQGVPTIQVELRDNSANLREAIIEGLKSLESAVCLTTSTTTSTTTATTTATTTTVETTEGDAGISSTTEVTKTGTVPDGEVTKTWTLVPGTTTEGHGGILPDQPPSPIPTVIPHPDFTFTVDIPPSPMPTVIPHPDFTFTGDIPMPTVIPHPDSTFTGDIPPFPMPTVIPHPDSTFTGDIPPSPMPTVIPHPDSTFTGDIPPSPMPTVIPHPDLTFTGDIPPSPMPTVIPHPDFTFTGDIPPFPMPTVIPHPDSTFTGDIPPSPMPTVIPHPDSTFTVDIPPFPIPTIVPGPLPGPGDTTEGGSDDDGGGQPTTTTSTSSTTTVPPVVGAIPGEEGSSSTAIIAGAAAGGAAMVAAGAAAFFKMAGTAGGAGTSATTVMDNAEVPEVIEEREHHQHISAEMFC